MGWGLGNGLWCLVFGVFFPCGWVLSNSACVIAAYRLGCFVEGGVLFVEESTHSIQSRQRGGGYFGRECNGRCNGLGRSVTIGTGVTGIVASGGGNGDGIDGIDGEQCGAGMRGDVADGVIVIALLW